MRRYGFPLGLAAAIGLGVAAAAPVAMLGAQTTLAVQPSERQRRRQILAHLDALPAKYRNRWKADRRRKHPNMNHVSRRTRRRHRRAKRA